MTLIVPTKFSKLYKLSFVILNLFRTSFIQKCEKNKNEKKLWKSKEWRDKEIQIKARGHSFMTSAKKYKLRILTPFSLLSINIEFWSRQTPLLDVLDWNSKPWVISEFSWKIIAIRSTLSCLANAYRICYSHMYNKTDRKLKSFSSTWYTFGVSITELQVKC